jgi:signal transduction histidine kinase
MNDEAATKRWAGSLIALGSAFLLVNFVVVLLEVATTNSLAEALLPSVPPLAVGGVLVYGGRWLSGSDLHPNTHPRIVAWCLGAAGLLLANVGLLVVLPDVRIDSPVQTVSLAVGIGALGGFAVGANEARAISRHREAQRSRETLAFLNSTLRHEVFNDINVIRGLATELSKHGAADRERLDAIVEHCDDVIDLIEDIEPLSEALAGTAETSPIVLSETVAERVAALETTHADASVTIDIPEDATVAATPGLSRAVSNVLVNAVEHNDSEPPCVDITATVSRETVRLRVADNGPGIDDAREAELFTESTDRDRGFGLYMTKRLVDHLGGDVRVEDNDPRGSVFVLELPRADVA